MAIIKLNVFRLMKKARSPFDFLKGTTMFLFNSNIENNKINLMRIYSYFKLHRSSIKHFKFARV